MLAIFSPFDKVLSYFSSKKFEAKIIRKLFLMKRNKSEFFKQHSYIDDTELNKSS